MILGAGLDRTGAMTVVSAWILKIGGGSIRFKERDIAGLPPYAVCRLGRNNFV